MLDRGLRTLEVALYCYGMDDFKCNQIHVHLQRIRNELILDHMIDLKVSLVDAPVAPRRFTIPKFPSADGFDKVPRLKIENMYVLMDDECTEERIKAYLLRTATYKFGSEVEAQGGSLELYEGMSEVGESEAIDL